MLKFDAAGRGRDEWREREREKKAFALASSFLQSQGKESGMNAPILSATLCFLNTVPLPNGRMVKMSSRGQAADLAALLRVAEPHTSSPRPR